MQAQEPIAPKQDAQPPQQRVVPALRIASWPRSKAFYASLGFVEQWTHQFEPNFPVFASVAFDGMEIFLTEHTGDCKFGGLVHFYVPDVDALYAQYVERGIEIAEAPNNGLGDDLRDMWLADPDGNRLMFLTAS